MKYDVVVIGGGPAGMIAAGRAGELGSSVLLVEKNNNLGLKLLVTGNGRCNITNKKDKITQMINMYGKKGKFLYSSFYKFGVTEIINFFENKGLKTKVENTGRVFPESDRAKDVLKTLLSYLHNSNVEIRTASEVKNIILENKKIKKIILVGEREIISSKYIIATGGKSIPKTGSTGDGFEWAKRLGHQVNKTIPILVPIILKEKVVKKLEGLSLKNVEISIIKNNKKIISKQGELIFTSNGVSGPVIINLSREIAKEPFIELLFRMDLFPDSNHKELDANIQKIFKENSNKILKNVLGYLLPQRLVPILLNISNVDGEKTINSVVKLERKKIIKIMKEFSLQISGLAGYEKAIVTSGGVDLKDVDPKTMKSKLIENLYFAGEVLDIDGPTGGYNLQIAWSTGYVSGEGAAGENLNNKAC